jgi:carboxylesterase type B
LLLSPFRAVHGTDLLPTSPLDAAAGSDVPLLAGTVRNETVDFVAALRGLPVVGSLALRGLRRTVGLDRTLLDAYRTGGRDLSGRVELAEAAWTDWGFRIPTIRLVEARKAPSWLYEFRWEPSTARRGQSSFHGIEIPFTRDDLAVVDQLPPTTRARFDGAPAALAAEMHGAWVDFVTTGDPGWPTYDTGERSTMVFDTPSAVVSDAAGVERGAWDGRR